MLLTGTPTWPCGSSAPGISNPNPALDAMVVMRLFRPGIVDGFSVGSPRETAHGE